MSTSEKSKPMVVFAKDPSRAKLIQSWLIEESSFFREGSYIVSISESAKPRGFKKLPKKMSRVLLVFEDQPVEINLVDIWRTTAMDRDAWEVHVAFLPFFEGPDDKTRYKEIVASCVGWNTPSPSPEEVKLEKYDYVEGYAEGQNLATLLTMTLGTMGDLLTKIEILGRRFKGSGKGGWVAPSALKDYRRQIDVLLKEEKQEDLSIPKLENEPTLDDLPKLLLYGDSGVGKSLIAGYLHRKAGGEGRPARIPIPEYLGKEDMFEYDLFGYCKGAYTGGKEEGSLGMLLSNVGRVVFLDEIGEANAYLQAKLLAFLDDYRVRPRGWEGEPFYCPVLIVAATNKNLVEMVEKGEFRGDLLARFTDRREIPGLNERIGDLPFILDCLLQRRAMNPGLKIEEIGKEAYNAFKDRDYEGENFRKLENLFRLACEYARRDARKFLVKSDIEKAAEEEW